MKEPVRATVHVGHQGATDAVVAEVREQCRARGLVKAKHLGTTTVPGSEKEFWADVAARAGVDLVRVIGHTAVFARKGLAGVGTKKRPRNA